MNEVFERVKKDESYRRHAYRCRAGVLTIGYGRNIDEEAGGPGVSEVESSFLLRNDLAISESHMKVVFNNWESMGQVRRNALINMRMNLGPGRFIGFRNMVAAIRRGSWGIAGMEARDSRWYYQVGSRAERIAKAIETGASI